MQWWRDAVFYQVYVPSFTDSDGDGLGDLQGVRSRLGYLELLGVDALWLSPIYPSPMVDNGYDITDHRAVDPVWGDLDAVDELVAAGLHMRTGVLDDNQRSIDLATRAMDRARDLLVEVDAMLPRRARPIT